MPRYNPATIEPKWQKFWEENCTFATPRLPKGPKIYVLDMFPYPSGDGLHVGHPEGYTATDIVCRYRRMRGFSVMHPMGWDAFGLPAEQHAKRTGAHPRSTTEKNIANFRRQLKMLGFSYDWQREVATTDADYFRWTQFIFLVLFDTWFDAAAQRGRPIAELPIPEDVAEQGDDATAAYRDQHRLAYQLEAAVNWCPALGTVLANEEVQGGVSERGGHPVVRMPLGNGCCGSPPMPTAWSATWTAWIGPRASSSCSATGSAAAPGRKSTSSSARSWSRRDSPIFVERKLGQSPAWGKPSPREYQGWLVDRRTAGFPEQPDESVLRIYTTRADTLFGATYMVIAPEHPLLERLTAPEQAAAVAEYCQRAARKSDLDRTDLAKEKTGVFTGSYAINPVNGEAIPIWVADYVLISYGTGAIMAVPAHDTRDFDFASSSPCRFGRGRSGRAPGARARSCWPAGGVHRRRHGGQLRALRRPDHGRVQERIAADLQAKGQGRPAVNYKLRDWLFSRQHFWGEPFPILHELDARGPAERLDPPPAARRFAGRSARHMAFDARHDRPEPPLEEAPADWLSDGPLSYATRRTKCPQRFSAASLSTQNATNSVKCFQPSPGTFF